MIFGDQDKTLKLLENEFKVSISPRGNFLKISGEETSVNTTGVALEKKFMKRFSQDKVINSGEINAIINIIKNSNMKKNDNDLDFINQVLLLEED